MILAMEAEGLKDQKIGMSGLIVDSVYSLSKEVGAGGEPPVNRRTLIQKHTFQSLLKWQIACSGQSQGLF